MRLQQDHRQTLLAGRGLGEGQRLEGEPVFTGPLQIPAGFQQPVSLYQGFLSILPRPHDGRGHRAGQIPDFHQGGFHNYVGPLPALPHRRCLPPGLLGQMAQHSAHLTLPGPLFDQPLGQLQHLVGGKGFFEVIEMIGPAQLGNEGLKWIIGIGGTDHDLQRRVDFPHPLGGFQAIDARRHADIQKNAVNRFPGLMPFLDDPHPSLSLAGLDHLDIRVGDALGGGIPVGKYSGRLGCSRTAEDFGVGLTNRRVVVDHQNRCLVFRCAHAIPSVMKMFRLHGAIGVFWSGRRKCPSIFSI